MFKPGVQVCSNRMYRYSTFGCMKKSSSKPIDIESSFEDLDARSSKVKMVRNLDKWFSRDFVFKLRFKKIKEKKLPLPPSTNKQKMKYKVR